MKIVFSWDDGAIEDLKLFALHRKYQFPGMFFVPTHNIEGRDVLGPEDIKGNCSDLIRFGGHTNSHVYLTTVPIASVEDEIVKNKRYLEENTGQEVEAFCLPGGKYNRKIIKIIRRHFQTCRTADTMSFRQGAFLLKPAIHFYDRGTKSLILNSIRHCSFREALFIFKHRKMDYFELIKALITFEAKRKRTIMIWGHSWEIEENNQWNKLEDLFRFISETFPDSVANYPSNGAQK